MPMPGKMNLYLNYFRKNEMTDGDNPPVGIVLCSNKNDSMVEYATAGLTQEVFVSKYLIHLPSVEKLKQLIQTDLNNSDSGISHPSTYKVRVIKRQSS